MTDTWTYFVPIFVAVVGVGALLFWALRKKPEKPAKHRPLEAVEVPGGHVIYMPQMRQALQRDDFSFLEERGSATLCREVKRQRTRVLLLYLDAMRHDFRRLLRLARVIAALSPEVAPAHEWERLLLSVRFTMNYALLRARLQLGMAALPQLSGLSQSVSELTMRIESAMVELGERAALASEMASTSHS